MKKILILLAVLLLITGCQSSTLEPTEIEFSKEEAVFPSPTLRISHTPFVYPTGKMPEKITASPTPPERLYPTATPSPTRKDWPEPYFGGTGPTPQTPVPTPLVVPNQTEKITFLLIGADRTTHGYFRTDTLILAIYFPEYQSANLISIPRDLYVYIPGWTMNRINTAFAHGEGINHPGDGFQLLMETIHYNLGIEVDHYALVDFTGFQDTIDILGGVNVNVLCPYTDWHLIEPDLDPEEEDNWELVTVGPGIIRMDGFESLWYARSRLRSDDFDRGRRQQEILRAIFNRALQLDVVLKVPQLYDQLNTKFITDLELDDLVDLAPYLLEVQPNKIHHYYIDRDQVNGWRTPGNAAVQLPDPVPFKALMEKASNPPKLEVTTDWEYEITIWNSSAKWGMESLAVERLNYLGIAAHSEVSGFGIMSQTLFYVYAAEPEESLVERITSNFNLTSGQIIYQSDSSSLQEYVLVLGQDFDPCYYPNREP